MKKVLLFLTSFLLIQITVYPQSNEEQSSDNKSGHHHPTFNEYLDECTIGVALGSATPDGRPLLWKTRDNTSAPNNEVKYVPYLNYHYVCVANAGSTTIPWMGLNEHGFAIINSAISDLPGGSGPGNGDVMWHALGYLKTVDDFQDYLDSTNITGRSTTANFAVIDANGNAAIFETGGNEYWKFDAEDEPNGYVLRTNFTMTGGGGQGINRYERTVDLVESFYTGDSLNYKSLLRYQMRDFSDDQSQPIPIPYPDQWASYLPYGYIPTMNSICKYSGVSAAVIQGILPDEDPRLSTMFAMLGQAAGAITVPYWPVGNTPGVANGNPNAPLCDLAIDIREMLFDCSQCSNCIDTYKLRDDDGNGLWSCTFQREDIILDSAEALLNDWRNSDTISVSEILEAENDLAILAYDYLESCYDLMLGIKNIIASNELIIYPNPARDNFHLAADNYVITEIALYSLTGQKVLVSGHSGKSVNISHLQPGMYIVEVTVEGRKVRQKLVVHR